MIAGIVTVILLVAFVAGAVRVYSGKRHAEFDAAARLPLEDSNENLP